MFIIDYIYSSHLIIFIQLISIICIIVLVIQIIDMKFKLDEYLHIKKNIYISDIETYKQKVIELLNDNELILQQKNSLIHELNEIKGEFEKLEAAYYDIERDNDIILNNIIINKEKEKWM